jgi:hypothetical protein
MSTTRKKFKGLSIFKIFKSSIKMKFEEFKDYVLETSSYIDKKVTKMDDEYSNLEKEGADEETLQEFIDAFENDYWRYDKMYKKFSYNSMILLVYGLFENELQGLCHYAEPITGSEIKLKDLAGDGYVNKCYIFLKKVAKIDLNDLKNDWKKIIRFQEIRNCIAHNDSKYNKNNPGLHKFFNEDERISLNEFNTEFFINDKEIILEFVRSLENFLLTVSDKLSEL